MRLIFKDSSTYRDKELATEFFFFLVTLEVPSSFVIADLLAKMKRESPRYSDL